jgi:hypothetical protein
MKQEGPYHILAPSSSGFNINSTTLTRTMEVTKHKYVVSISIKKKLAYCVLYTLIIRSTWFATEETMAPHGADYYYFV